jgi:endonuclease V-like protein UPF0215 family
MAHEIRRVKREIRILGIDACRRGSIIGAIIRGGLYLDGILTFHETTTKRLGEEIRESRYYPELRIIMLHDPKSRLDTQELWKATGLPIIEITKSKSPSKNTCARFEKKNKTIYARSKLNPETIRKIIRLSWVIDDLPEPVRVAHSLVNSISSGPISR